MLILLIVLRVIKFYVSLIVIITLSIVPLHRMFDWLIKPHLISTKKFHFRNNMTALQILQKFYRF